MNTLLIVRIISSLKRKGKGANYSRTSLVHNALDEMTGRRSRHSIFRTRSILNMKVITFANGWTFVWLG